MIVHEIAKIISNVEIAPGYFQMIVDSPAIAQDALPGQFAEIRVSDTLDPLLRRPISFFDYGEGSLQFIYRVVGYGTTLLSRKVAGEVLDILGPIGTGFDLSLSNTKPTVVLGGGMGIIPLYPLIKSLMHKKIDFMVLNGARNRQELLLLDRFQKEGIPFSAITDDGSFARKGFVTELLQEQFARDSVGCVYSCGPHGMLAAVAGIMKAYSIPCQVSLEEKMACGLGACLGCVVMTTHGDYKKVCKDGPVFMSTEIQW